MENEIASWSVVVIILLAGSIGFIILGMFGRIMGNASRGRGIGQDAKIIIDLERRRNKKDYRKKIKKRR